MNMSSQFTDETETKVIIDTKYLRYLEDRDLQLDALEIGGVDNWEWFDEAMKEYRRLKTEEDD